MAGRIITRDTANLVLAGVMAVALVVALIGGTVAIVRFGRPEGASATLVAEIFAWVFAVAFLATFFLTVSESQNARRAEH